MKTMFAPQQIVHFGSWPYYLFHTITSSSAHLLAKESFCYEAKSISISIDILHKTAENRWCVRKHYRLYFATCWVIIADVKSIISDLSHNRSSRQKRYNTSVQKTCRYLPACIWYSSSADLRRSSVAIDLVVQVLSSVIRNYAFEKENSSTSFENACRDQQPRHRYKTKVQNRTDEKSENRSTLKLVH